MKELPKSAQPARLKEITDPPERLFLEGVLPPETHRVLAVVGSRRYSTYGKEVTEMLIAGLAGYPIVIVSGLALGIDAIAHKSALLAKLPTIAVPGSGLSPSVLYPSGNRSLAKEIVASGGALLSEFAPDFRATTWSFPQRNRIIAGLSDAVLVIEAEQKSGALITSKFATEYNRDVYTVPHSIFSPTGKGPHMLIGLGATPITSSSDLLSALGFAHTSASTPDSSRFADCTREEKMVIALLREPMPRDELVDALPLPVGEVNALLSRMELSGFISETGGNIRLT